MTGPVLVTGGAGYVGSVLVDRLLRAGRTVRVLDLCLYGEESLESSPRLELVTGDLRDSELVRRALDGCRAVIHLACISNDPSFELDPELGRKVNYEAFEPLCRLSVEAGVERFVYASSSSVYGVSGARDVGEDHPLAPLTDYSRYKALCEPIVLGLASDRFCPIVIRPATVCGPSPRMRFDLTVNILTNHAVNSRKIRVFGGSQLRPNLHILDMVELYLTLLELPRERVFGATYNYGCQNLAVSEIAMLVKRVVEREMPELGPIAIETTSTDDLRSYHVSSRRIFDELGLFPKRTIEQAVSDVCAAFRENRFPNPLDDDRYYNVRRMQRLGLR